MLYEHKPPAANELKYNYMEIESPKIEHNFNTMSSIETIILRKKHSPHLVRITPDGDPHFSVVQLVKLATREVRASHFILTSDVQQWQGLYERDGFRQVKGGSND